MILYELETPDGFLAEFNKRSADQREIMLAAVPSEGVEIYLCQFIDEYELYYSRKYGNKELIGSARDELYNKEDIETSYLAILEHITGYPNGVGCEVLPLSEYQKISAVDQLKREIQSAVVEIYRKHGTKSTKHRSEIVDCFVSDLTAV